MRKYLPIALPILGILVLVGGFMLVRSRRTEEVTEEETQLIEVALPDRPVASLTPSEDGHTLVLSIEKIQIPGAFSLDYELLYDLPDGRTQGVPGTIEIKGQKSITRELLLGSESSGKKRYDEGVEKGTLTLRFRNDKGKLITKFATDFRLQSKIRELSTVDGKFAYALDKIPAKAFFVTMQTFGVPEMPSGTVSEGPYGVFSSVKTGLAGKVSLTNAQRWTGTKWESLTNGVSSNVGIFVSSN